jgi:hypothetical protein
MLLDRGLDVAIRIPQSVLLEKRVNICLTGKKDKYNMMPVIRFTIKEIRRVPKSGQVLKM